MLLVYSLALMLGEVIGGLLALYFFKNLYGPLKEALAIKSMKSSSLG